MPEENSHFKVAIAATEKAIEAKSKKLVQVKADYELGLDWDSLHETILSLANNIGRQEGLLEWGTKAEKLTAEKELKKLNKEYARLKKIDSVELITVELDLEQEIEQLTSELRVLTNMSNRNPRYIL